MLRHAIGRSTFKEGFTIPRKLERWINAPEKGEKRKINLIFDGLSVPAILRRLDNERGHVQIRYSHAAGKPFRNWLTTNFRASLEKPCGEYLELTKIEDNYYLVKAFPLSSQKGSRLAVTEWLFHEGDGKLFDIHSALWEIPAIVQDVEFNCDEGQRYYNHSIASGFKTWGWEAERQVILGLPLKCDFSKDLVQVEIEFGNARTYYQDYIKFMLAYNQGTARVGVLVIPTQSFARTLCEIGRKNALKTGGKSYSGMIHLEKVRRELEYLKFMLKMPIVVSGIGEPCRDRSFD